MKTIYTPNNLKVLVPEHDSEDVSPKFTTEKFEDAKTYFNENGYVVFKGLIEENDIDQIVDLWEKEVKPSNSFIYRQATAKAERHVKNENGWVMNPILNIQSVNPNEFKGFRNLFEDKIVSTSKLESAYRYFLKDDPKVVQSMFFEGNSATWEHQDSYYLDSENLGDMIGSWIALEEIKANAGRFFICPKSHLIDLGKQNSKTNIADSHDVYIKKVVELMREDNMEIRAPKLNKGDVLFWHAWTIHGSLKSDSKTHTRKSITNHVIPNKDLFLQFQTRLFDLKTDKINDTYLFRPKDQAKLKSRILLAIEGNFPKQFYWLKRKAIKFLVSKN
jgi:phytanoyl-CoA hydroxylase